MDPEHLTYPDGLSAPSEPKVGQFERLIWYNSEVCNNCFQRIRRIGETIEKRTDLFVHELITEYERSEHGSQEYDPFLLPSDRYGRCFCLDCGTDTRSTNDTLEFELLCSRLNNIIRYIRDHTDEEMDWQAAARTAGRLKSVRENQGYDSEIFCVATIQGLEAAERPQSPTAAATAD